MLAGLSDEGVGLSGDDGLGFRFRVVLSRRLRNFRYDPFSWLGLFGLFCEDVSFMLLGGDGH